MWGSPVTPWFHDWAWNRMRGEDIKKHWNLIPDETTILLTHGPPKGILDRLSKPNNDGETNPGCEELMEAVLRVKPLIHSFGHIHEGRGMTEKDGITFVNSSCLNEYYDPVHIPVILEI